MRHLSNAVARHIASALRFSPCGNHQHADNTGRSAYAAFSKRYLGVEHKFLGQIKCGLFIEPCTAPIFNQFIFKKFKSTAQVSDIGQRISQLIVAQWTLAPSVNRPALSILPPGFTNERFITYSITKTAHHSGNLRVKKRFRNDLRLMEKFQYLGDSRA